jgi:hypothetical protein
MRIQEMAAAQALPANLTNADVGGAGVFAFCFQRIALLSRSTQRKR